MNWFHTVCVVIRDIWPWWCNQIESFSVLLAPCAGKSPVTGEFPSQRPVTRRFGVFFVLRLWWTSARPLAMCRMGGSSQSSTDTEYEAKTSSGSRTSSETALNQWLSRNPLLCCYKASCLSNGAHVTKSKFFIDVHHIIWPNIHAAVKLRWSLYANHWLSCKSLAFEDSSGIGLMLLNE